MAYPGRQGHHYQSQQGGGGGGYPQQQMPMPSGQYNQGPPPMAYNNAPPPGHYGQPPLQYGQPGQTTQSDYQGQQINWNRPQGPQMAGNQRYEYSNMQGKRKALLIGINYIG